MCSHIDWIMIDEGKANLLQSEKKLNNLKEIDWHVFAVFCEMYALEYVKKTVPNVYTAVLTQIDKHIFGKMPVKFNELKIYRPCLAQETQQKKRTNIERYYRY